MEIIKFCLLHELVTDLSILINVEMVLSNLINNLIYVIGFIGIAIFGTARIEDFFLSLKSFTFYVLSLLYNFIPSTT